MPAVAQVQGMRTRKEVDICKKKTLLSGDILFAVAVVFFHLKCASAGAHVSS